MERKTVSIRSMLDNASSMVGRRDHGDDASQFGGDFIVGKDSILRLVYPSRDPADRPPVEKLLNVLEQINSNVPRV